MLHILNPLRSVPAVTQLEKCFIFFFIFRHAAQNPNNIFITRKTCPILILLSHTYLNQRTSEIIYLILILHALCHTIEIESAVIFYSLRVLSVFFPILKQSNKQANKETQERIHQLCLSSFFIACKVDRFVNTKIGI